MATLQPKDLLDTLLEGNALASDELKAFIQQYPDEGQLFDYKDGIITKPDKRKEGAQIIRKWTSGFANSEGGVLIVGVNEDKPRGISPCELNIGGQPLTEWATRCLQGMAGFFSPPPRFRVVNLDEGSVLTIAVARAPSFMWCIDEGRPKYFLRIGESTVEAPDYLISDLVLGRRQHPILDLHLPAIEDRNAEIRNPRNDDRTPARSLHFRFTIENVGLVTAEDVAIGVVARSLIEDGKEELNQHLRLFLDSDESLSATHSLSHIIHRSSATGGAIMPIAPFQTANAPRIGTIYIDRGVPLKVSCAIYILAKGAPPTWFQLEFHSLPGGMAVGNVSDHLKPLIIRKGSERPRVAWEEVSWRP
jgi:hypothetical protein